MQSLILVSPFRPSFLDTKSLSSLGCKVLCIVINFLVLFSISLSFLVHFKNGLVHITRGTAQVFISLMRFLLQSIVLRRFFRSFEVLLSYISFISACLIVSASDISESLSFSFSPSVLILFRFGSSIPSHIIIII